MNPTDASSILLFISIVVFFIGVAFMPIDIVVEDSVGEEELLENE